MINDKSISLCMVVSNDYHLAINAINSVKSIIDEVVIVDQSTDIENQKQFKEIADLYIHTTSKGNADFDRQYCYMLAGREYILAMDSDEIVLPEELEKFKQIFEYQFELTWFLFRNLIRSNGICVDLKKFLQDDPHPRLWRKFVNVGGQLVPTVVWTQEAHQFPRFNTQKQIYSNIWFDHNRELVDVINTHLRRGKNISPEALQTEKNFIRSVLNEFGVEVKKDIVIKIPELQRYLRN